MKFAPKLFYVFLYTFTHLNLVFIFIQQVFFLISKYVDRCFFNIFLINLNKTIVWNEGTYKCVNNKHSDHPIIPLCVSNMTFILGLGRISGQRLIYGILPDIRPDNRISGIKNQPDIRYPDSFKSGNRPYIENGRISGPTLLYIIYKL